MFLHTLYNIYTTITTIWSLWCFIYKQWSSWSQRRTNISPLFCTPTKMWYCIIWYP